MLRQAAAPDKPTSDVNDIRMKRGIPIGTLPVPAPRITLSTQVRLSAIVMYPIDSRQDSAWLPCIGKLPSGAKASHGGNKLLFQSGSDRPGQPVARLLL